MAKRIPDKAADRQNYYRDKAFREELGRALEKAADIATDCEARRTTRRPRCT